MDIENLNKTQIILLTLLVSFVTSIATGIVTVSLLQQAPPALTQTINRVVEKTVERVIEKDPKGGEPKIITKEKTVLVKESDLVADAVKSAIPYTVSVVIAVKEPAPEEGGEAKEVQKFIARGVFVSGDTVATDATGIAEDSVLVIKPLASQTEIPVTKIKIVSGVAYLTLEKGSGQSAQKAEGGAIQLGETLILVGGTSRPKVSTGIVSDIVRSESGALSTLSVPVDATPGTPLVTMEGKLVALLIGGGWVPAGMLQ